MNFSLPLALLLSAVPLHAQWLGPDGQPVPDNASTKSRNGFGAMILLTDTPDQFLAEWDLPPEHRPQIKTTEHVARNDTIVAFVVFTGCAPKDGLCDSSVDFTVLRPDGSLYAEHKGVELWRAKPAPPPGNVQLGLPQLGIRIEPKDPLGRYTVRAAVTDHVSHTTLDLAILFDAIQP